MKRSEILDTNAIAKDSGFSEKQLCLIYDAVFRDSVKQAGFYFLDFGSQIDSNSFRQKMIDLKNGLSNLCLEKSNNHLVYQSIGRFNHQHSSKFHRDTADEHSFLMLGYEPSKIKSNVFIADYSKYLAEEKMTLEDYFQGDKFANLVNDAEPLAPYITELLPFNNDTYRLVLINNSMSYTDPSFGVFHSAEIAEKNEGEDRVLNYIMMHFCDKRESEHFAATDIENFIHTERIDR